MNGLLILDKVEGNKVHRIVLGLDFATVFSLLLILKGSANCGLLRPEALMTQKYFRPQLFTKKSGPLNQDFRSQTHAPLPD